MEKPVITLDRFLSIWIFLYTILYLFGIVPYNPVILISIALSFFLISLFIIIPRLNEKSLLTYYISINTLAKIIPLLLIINRLITFPDIIFSIIFILFYLIYMRILNVNILSIYTDYIEFIIDSDTANDGAIYHYFNKLYYYKNT